MHRYWVTLTQAWTELDGLTRFGTTPGGGVATGSRDMKVLYPYGIVVECVNREQFSIMSKDSNL